MSFLPVQVENSHLAPNRKPEFQVFIHMLKLSPILLTTDCSCVLINIMFTIMQI